MILPSPTWLKQTIVPLSMLVILSSCLVLAWYLYTTVYQPLFATDATVMTASDYAIPTVKLENTLEALETRNETSVDFSAVPNRFTAQPE